MNAISLFSGIGGIELGLQLVIPDFKTIRYVEQNQYCRQVLQARMRDGYLCNANIHDDVRTFDGSEWRGRCDLICGGFPCQGISNAGQRKGLADERSGLWFEFACIIRAVGPRYVFLENVAALANRGLDVVLGALADSGYDAQWDVFSAAEVGAPHLRKRLFILAYRDRERQSQLQGLFADLGGWPRDDSGAMGDTASARRGWAEPASKAMGRPKATRRLQPGRPSSSSLGHPERQGLALGGSKRCNVREEQSPAERAGAPLFPPGPADRERWATLLGDTPHLAPAVPAVRGVADGAARRVERLRGLGNSVVPLVAAHAWRTLFSRIGDN